MFRSGLKFVAGAAAGIVLWIYLTPAYNALLARASEPLLHLDRRLRNTEVLASDRRITARGDVEQPDLPPILIPADQLTYNIILLLGLFATNRAPLRDRGASRLAIAAAVLVVSHILATAVAIEATYATRTGEWGSRNYSAPEQDVWSALEYGYRLAGMFGIAFGCWWMTRQVAGGSIHASGG